MGKKVKNKPINPIPPSPELSPWKRNIGTNPMMLRMTPPDNKIIPIRFLVFTGSSLAKSSTHHHRKRNPSPHAIGIFHSIITLNIFPSSIEKNLLLVRLVRARCDEYWRICGSLHCLTFDAVGKQINLR